MWRVSVVNHFSITKLSSKTITRAAAHGGSFKIPSCFWRESLSCIFSQNKLQCYVLEMIKKNRSPSLCVIPYRECERMTLNTYSVLLCSFDLTILPSAVLPVPKCYQQLAAIDFQPRAADYRLEVLLEACRSSRLNFNSDSAA